MSIETMPEKSLDDVKGDARQAEYERISQSLTDQEILDELIRIVDADVIVNCLPESVTGPAVANLVERRMLR